VNYRHAFHAGNFADVLKHVVLSRLIEYLKRKDKAFRVIDTHAGHGLYDLRSDEASRTGEWRDGIGRLFGKPQAPDIAALLDPYLGAVRAANPDGDLSRYPGSPAVARHLIRRQDRLSLVELHPEEAERLSFLFADDVQVRVIELDGWLALGAHLPPKEKRGLVLVDPPFEVAGEFDRILAGLRKAHRRWPGGTYAIWYPIKDRIAVSRFREELAKGEIPNVMDLWQMIRPQTEEPRLDGSGVVLVNPPFTLEAEMKLLLPALTRILERDRGGNWGVDWLAPEQTAA